MLNKKYFWTKKVGKFINRDTGKEIILPDKFNNFIGLSQREWNETLNFAISHVLFNKMNCADVTQAKIFCSKEILSILKTTLLFDEKENAIKFLPEGNVQLEVDKNLPFDEISISCEEDKSTIMVLDL